MLAESTRVLTVATIEDRRDMRGALGMLIDATPGFHCAGRHRSMEEALRAFEGRAPDVVLCDIDLPGVSGIEGMRIMRENYPEMLTLMLTVCDDDERTFQALCAGARGYLLKHTAPARLLECLEEAVAGGAPMSPEVAVKVVALFHRFRPPENADYNLTPREARLLELLVEGHNYKSAAVELKVTAHTISFHMRRIYEKLQVHSKSEAVARALRSRLLD
jgi:DNA-binding NarL/FixJ family response regulator